MTQELVVIGRNKAMSFARILAGTILALTLAQTVLAASGARTPAAQPGDGATGARTVEQLQAENQALKAEVARLQPPTIWQKLAMIAKLQPPGVWYLVGFFGQFVFFMRFVVQWIASERKKQSVVPLAFWYISLAGSLITIVYAVHIKDPVFTASFCLNILIYIRNLHLIHGKPRPPAAAPA
jgi:lipid-A-disaccharide synthase-like uncharacterized protein